MPRTTVDWDMGGDYAVLVVVGQRLVFETFCRTIGLATFSRTAVSMVLVVL